MLTGSFVCEFVQTYLMQYTGQLAMFDLRRQLMEHLQDLDLAFYDRNPVGRLVTRVTTDVDVLNDLFASGLVTILGDVLVLLFILGIMFSFSPLLTAIMLAAMPFVILTTVIFRRSVTAELPPHPRGHRHGSTPTCRSTSPASWCCSSSIASGAAAREFEEVNRQHMDAFKDAITAYGWFYPVVEFISMLALAGILTYGGFRIQAGAPVPGRGRGVPAIRPALLPPHSGPEREVQHPAIGHGLLRAHFQTAGYRAADRGRPRVSAPRPADHRADRIRPRLVRLQRRRLGAARRELHHRARRNHRRRGPYRRRQDHAHQPAAALLRRAAGSIRVGGIDVRDFDPLELRRQFGVVLQDPYLFTGTLAENIRLGTEGIRDEAVEAAAEQVNLMDFIRTLPEGFGHSIRERGSGLSTGQKQLISFARALAHNPRYLILDEATSSVDTETEFRVRDALNRMVEGRTSIVIAHRLSTIQRADRILVMHKGKLRESGTHQELLAQRGIYWKLYQLQYKDQERVA